MNTKLDDMIKLSERRISDELLKDISRYIDSLYIGDHVRFSRVMAPAMASKAMPMPDFEVGIKDVPEESSLEELLNDLDAGFSETLLALIDRSGKKDSEIYKKANVDRKLFSKIRNNPDYQPSKATAISFAIALELEYEEAEDFIGRAGYALSHSSKFDIIIEYFIRNKRYDIFEINEALLAFDQNLLGV